jgi:polyisoprenyl-phosphate glycosyltransferase
MHSGPLLSVVIPVYDEIEVLPELYRRLTEALGDIEVEIVFVDDHSTDGSWERLGELAAHDPRLRLLRLSRNFGHQIAITAGLDVARGDPVVVMDGDLQDPPELIPSLLEKWREGYDVVYAVRIERPGESWFKRVTAAAFYRVFRWLAQVDLPKEAGDFRLYSRRAADALRNMPERARFIRGMSTWIGFRQIGIDYQREPRFAGETKYPFRKMAKFSADAIFSFSTTPLRLMSGFGFLVVVFCIAYLMYILYEKVFTNDTIQGFTSVVVLVALLGGVQLFSLGIVGQYIARIFEEAKRRPLYILEQPIVEHPSQPTVAATPESTRLPS